MAASRKKLAIFPAFHSVEGRFVVVVGNGDEAAAKVRLIGETSAETRVFSTDPNETLRRDATIHDAQIIARLPARADFETAALAFIATGDADLDRVLRDEAKAAGIPVNVVDRPTLCDFHTPALVNRAPLAVAIGTAGVAPVLARQVRARIETLLAPAFGDLASLADRIRSSVVSASSSGEARRRFWARFFSGSVAQKVFAGNLADAEADAVKAIESMEFNGHVSLVGAGPGAADLLTLRAQRALQEADVIVYDKLVPEAIVSQGRRDAERIFVGKAKGAHSASQTEINAILIREAEARRRVVRLKSGDPLIFGRAGEEIDALRQAGISFDIVPGITAAFAAAAETEIPLTLRGVASSLTFVTGHDADGETLPDWAGLALQGTTVVVYMGLTVAAKVARQLVAAGLNPATPVAIVENASLPNQRAFAGQLDDLGRSTAELSGPALFMIGEVVAAGKLAIAPSPIAELAA